MPDRTSDTADLAARLLRWYRRRRRDLPWRRPAPAGQAAAYRTWVAEIMLQQTRVEAVAPRFEAFLDRFPRVEELAAAPVEEVLRLWSGMGYYRRARNLHAAARLLCREQAGRLPRTAAGWRRLPGVGEYTAAAIASIAAGEAVPVVDGNVCRVAARILEVEAPAASPALQRAAREWAAALHADRPPRPGNVAGDLNQALMELGATVCTPKAPDCRSCPVAGCCRARAAGREGELPRPRRAPPVREVGLVFALAVRGGEVLLEQRREGWNPGLWEPPSWPAPPPGGLAAAWRCRYGPGRPRGEVRELRHSITCHRIRARVVEIQGWNGRDGRRPEAVALTGLARKILRAFSLPAT